MTAYDDYENLICDFPEPGLLRIVISNPGTLNSCTAGMHTALAKIWNEIDNDPNVSCVLVTGADGAFSSGGDFGFIASLVDDWDARQRVMKEVRDIVHGMVNCSKPVVSAIAGPCAGVGAAVALMADISIASPSARFIDGHTRFGVAAGDHAVILWPLLCGMAKAKYYLLMSDTITGEDAERMGMVSMLVPDDQLEETAMKVTKRLMSLSETAVQWTKQSLNGWFRLASPMYDVSAAYENLGFSGPDIREGIAALREKRRPVFKKAGA